MKAVIMLGSYTYSKKDYCWKDFISAIVDLEVPKNVDLEIHIVDNTAETDDYFMEIGKRLKDYPNIFIYHLTFHENEDKRRVVASSENFLRQLTLDDDKYSHLFIVESDDVLNDRDLVHLYEDNMPVITGITPYNSKNTMVYKKLVWNEPENSTFFTSVPFINKGFGGLLEGNFQLYSSGGWYTHRDEYNMAEIDSDAFETVQKVAGSSLGCALIERSVLEKISFRYRTDVDNKDFPDIFFYIDCIRNRIPVFVDKRVRPKHLWKNWSQTQGLKP
jgi:hypothetical protein